MNENKQEYFTENLQEKATLKPIRNYKDRVFRMIFKDKHKLLELYNAINGTVYQDPGEMTITTLENALYLGMKNDVSFVLHDQLSLYEHQATDNPNMPLRNLFYISDVYSGMIVKDDLHNMKQVRIPEPKFLVFYNGTKDMPERWEQKLSDSYFDKADEPALELRIIVLNINLGRNQELADKCRPLQEYMIFVVKVREYNKIYPFEQAVEMAVADCIREGIMADFLLKNRSEVVRMSIYEYNEEKVRQVDMAYGREEGLKEGLKERNRLLIKIICKELERGQRKEVIFDRMSELEVDSDMVKKITEIAEKFAVEYDWSEVCDKIIELL